MSTLNFEVMMEPKGKARPRVVHNAGRVHSFTPEATKKAEDIIRHMYKDSVLSVKVCKD